MASNKKITNYQLNLIVDKIYQTLRKEIDIKNKEIQDSFVPSEVLLSEIEEFYEIKERITTLQTIKDRITKRIEDMVGMGISFYNFETREKLINIITIAQAPTIKMSKQDIEFEVLTNSLDDIGSLVEKITNSMREKFLSSNE